MANTALNRTTQVLLTNKSGGNLNYGDVVVLDNTNSNGFTTTTTSGLSTRQIGIILEPNGIANNASGMVATGGWAPKCNLNTAATIGQFVKSHTVAGQGTSHSSPQQEGDFAVALTASATPPVCLFGSPNGPTSGTGTVTNTGTLTSGKTIVGNGSADVTVSSLTAQFVGSSSGTAAAASMTTARLLGRTTASSGAVEEIAVSTGLSLSAGTLTATGSASGFVLLEQHTASTSTTLDFTTFISSTYDTYHFEFVNILPETASTLLWMRMGTGGGPTYDSGANYTCGQWGWRAGGSSLGGGGGSQNQIGMWLTAAGGMSTTSTSSGSGFAKLYNPQSASIHKSVTGRMEGLDTAGPNWLATDFFGIYNSTTAVTAVQFLMSSGHIASGTIRVYGLLK